MNLKIEAAFIDSSLFEKQTFENCEYDLAYSCQINNLGGNAYIEKMVEYAYKITNDNGYLIINFYTPE